MNDPPLLSGAGIFEANGKCSEGQPFELTCRICCLHLYISGKEGRMTRLSNSRI